MKASRIINRLEFKLIQKVPLVNITEKIMLLNHIYSNLHHAASAQWALTVRLPISRTLRLIFSILGKTQCSIHTLISRNMKQNLRGENSANSPACRMGFLAVVVFHLTVEDCFISRVDQCLPLRFVLMLRRHHLLRLCFYYIQNIVPKSESTPKKCFYFSYGPVMKCTVCQIRLFKLYSMVFTPTVQVQKQSLFFLPESTATIM